MTDSASPLTPVRPDDRLPLTCTRSGACCRAKAVCINPWEIACLAAARRVPVREFRDRFTVDGGIRLALGPSLEAICSQYDPAAGCLAHSGRPLACRLYPLGRIREGQEVRYGHEGESFPCLSPCPEAGRLPPLSVRDYLAGQEVGPGEAAQEAYLEMVQDLAEGALVLFLDSGLSASGDRETLCRWRDLARFAPEARGAAIPAEWLDRLLLPSPAASLADASAWTRAHRDGFAAEAQRAFGSLRTASELRDACATMFGLALHLAGSLGIEAGPLAQRWIRRAERG